MRSADLRDGQGRWRFSAWPVALQLTVGPLALLTVLLLTVGSAIATSVRARATAAAVVETFTVVDEATDLTRLVIDQETGIRGFALTRDEAFLEPYLAARDAARARLAGLRARSAGDGAAQAHLDRVAAMLDDWEAVVATPMIAATRAGGDPGAIVRTGAGKRRTDAVRTELRAFGEAASQELVARQARDRAGRIGAYSVFVVALAAAGGACLVAVGAARGVAGPARVLALAAARIAAGDLSARVGGDAATAGAGGSNELAVAGRAFDSMAAALARARAEQDAAGHALREVARLREERHQAVEAELARAAQLQADLLPHVAPTVAGLDVAARCLPARRVGGDFFDWHEPAPGVLTLTLGDVMGKGLSAALLMATVRAALDTADGRRSPAQTLDAVAAATHPVLERAGAFVTLFHARAEAATARVTYADAGHGHTFVRRAGGAVEGLPARGLPLGVLPGEHYPAGALDLAPGDALVIYSDGLLDARPDLALTAEVLAARLDDAASAAEIVDRLTALADASHDLPDDLTVVVLRRRVPASV
jgi:serine phosphatase RsbU (regulator of sigma subunit)/CHASE3 domain sensor protein